MFIGASLALVVSVGAATNSSINHLNTLFSREAWNQTFVDGQRARCKDRTTAQVCCPGYCPWDYTYDNGKKTAETCCPADYYLSFFGNAKVGYHDMECCDGSVKNCQLGSDTKKPQAPFSAPQTDVGFLQQDCESRSGAAGLELAWKVLLPVVGVSILCMMSLAL